MDRSTALLDMPNSKIINLSTSIIFKLLLALLSGSLLSLAFLDHTYFYCAWFGFIPLLLAIDKTTLLQSYLIGLITGLTMVTTSAYWIVDFIAISKDYGVQSGFLLAGLFWLYSAHSIALAILVFNGLRQYFSRLELLLFPLTLVIFSFNFPMLFNIHLGDTQVDFPIALQAIEFFGVHSLDFIIVLFNILIYRFLVNAISISPNDNQRSKLPILVSTLLIASWFTYGAISYSSWQEKIATWDTLKVGMVQMNEIPKLGDRAQYPGYSEAYPPEMEMTERLSSAEAEIIIWPEAQSKKYLDDDTVKLAYQQNIKRLNKDLLFQDTQHIRDPISGNINTKYNTAIMINGNGQQVGSYQKMKRIPFGEYVPVLDKKSLPSKWIERLFGDFNSELSKGQEHQVFKHSKINIIPLICYETTFPEFVGEAVQQTLTQRNLAVGTLLVGLSNDGWFGSTHLPYQHVMPSVLRAVENRLPLVHVANNGPSIAVTPDGSVIFTSAFQQSAGYVVDIPHSNAEQGSFYSRHPSLFNNMMKGLFVLILLAALKEWKRRAMLLGNKSI